MSPHYRIGWLEAQAELDKAHVARLQAEINALRAAMIARLTILESMPATATREDLQLQVDITIERLGDALYPESAEGRCQWQDQDELDAPDELGRRDDAASDAAEAAREEKKS